MCMLEDLLSLGLSDACSLQGAGQSSTWQSLVFLRGRAVHAGTLRNRTVHAGSSAFPRQEQDTLRPMLSPSVCREL